MKYLLTILMMLQTMACPALCKVGVCCRHESDAQSLTERHAVKCCGKCGGHKSAAEVPNNQPETPDQNCRCTCLCGGAILAGQVELSDLAISNDFLQPHDDFHGQTVDLNRERSFPDHVSRWMLSGFGLRIRECSLRC